MTTHNAKRVADHPAGRFERSMLDQIIHPDATSVFHRSWTIVQALRVSKPVDAGRLATAFRQVVARHETLRARFVRRQEGWRMVVEDQHRTGPRITDLGDVTDDFIAGVVARARDELFDIENGPLFQMELLRCGKRGDVLVLRVHHLVTDGWSQIVIFDELLRAGYGLPFANPRPLTYGEYLARYEKAATPALEARNDAYWRRLLLPAAPMPRLGRVARGLPPNLCGYLLGPTSRMSAALDKARLDAIHEAGRSAGFTLSNLVGAAFATVLAREAGVDSIYYNTPYASRTTSELQGFVGLACDYVPVRADVTAAGSLAALAKAIGQQMQLSFQHVPSAVTKCDGTADAEVNDAGGHLRQFACSMPMPESVMRGSLLAPILDGMPGRVMRIGGVEVEWLDASGTRADSAEFDLRVVEHKGGLELIVNYDTNAFSSEEAGSMLRQIANALGSVSA